MAECALNKKDAGRTPAGSPDPEWTAVAAGALTVAGQWRNLTAFPSILAIRVVDELRHGGAATMSSNQFPRHQHYGSRGCARAL